MTTSLYPIQSLRVIEQAAQSSLPPGTLMARAGAAIARQAQTMALERAGEILILVGPGNNGGDALIAARLLHAQGMVVRVALLDAPARFSGDAQHAWLDWHGLDANSALTLHQPPKLELKITTLVIDGLFGIGLNAGYKSASRPLPSLALDWIAQVNASHLPVLAIDIPSGLDADTGSMRGIAIEATHTLTLLGHKPGLYTADGPDHCGSISMDALNVNQVDVHLPTSPEAGSLNDPALFKAAWRPRRLNSHKGQFGSLGIVGGAESMVGAALLAARMGLHAGAGRTYVQLLAETAPAFDGLQLELMLRPRLSDLELQALVIGPGMGASAHLLLAELLARAVPMVLDADALNTISNQLDLREAVAIRGSHDQPTILTPHPLEAARLLDIKVAEVQADRIAAAQELARHYRSIVILKGAGSVIAHPDGRWVVNPTGNPALATGGTGDVLAGLIGALLAQGMEAWPAALAATWLHGAAADQLRDQGIGPIGLTASELIPAIRRLLNECAFDQASDHKPFHP